MGTRNYAANSSNHAHKLVPIVPPPQHQGQDPHQVHPIRPRIMPFSASKNNYDSNSTITTVDHPGASSSSSTATVSTTTTATAVTTPSSRSISATGSSVTSPGSDPCAATSTIALATVASEPVHNHDHTHALTLLAELDALLAELGAVHAALDWEEQQKQPSADAHVWAERRLEEIESRIRGVRKRLADGLGWGAIERDLQGGLSA